MTGPCLIKAMKLSQNEMIKRHLLTGRTITPLEALRLYGCFRLGARIFDLNNQGMKIVNLRKSGQYAVYKLQRETLFEL